MTDLVGLLTECRDATGAAAVALVAEDGLPIDGVGGDGLDLDLAAAEATDLLTVAKRLVGDALPFGAVTDLALQADRAHLRLQPGLGGAFLLLLSAEGADAAPSALPALLSQRLREALQ